MNIQMAVEELNQLYHRIINSRANETDRERFKLLVAEIKGCGYRFKIGIPNTDFRLYDLNDYETKLFIRLEIVQILKLDAQTENLFWFATYMRDAEKLLCRSIHVSLCQREILNKKYFLIRDKKKIDFMQSGHTMDIYPLFQTN